MSRPGTALSAKSNPDLLRSPSMQAESGKLSLMLEDDHFLRKWSGPMILGPLLPAMFSLMTIVSGHLVLNTWTGYCGYSLDSFVSAALFICYLFLMVFAWSFFGEKVYLNVPLTGTGFYLLRPFSSLKWLIIAYFTIAFMSFIIWSVGAQLLSLSIFCAGTAPSLYNYTLYLVVTYWIGFFIIGCYLIKLKFGNFIEGYISSHAQGPSVEDMEERIFRKEFKNFDKKKLGTIPQESLSDFFVKVAVFIPEEELPGVLNELGVVGNEEIEFNQLLPWFKAYNVKMNGYGNVGGDEEEEEEEDPQSKKKNKTGGESSGGGGGGMRSFFNRNKTESNPKEPIKQTESLPVEPTPSEKDQSKKRPAAAKEEDEEEED